MQEQLASNLHWMLETDADGGEGEREEDE